MSTYSNCRKVLCVGRNYAKHCIELGNPIPTSPLIFLKTPSNMVLENNVVKLDQTIGEIHHEVELAVVIGKNCVDVPVKDALKYVGGYTVCLDLTARDIQTVDKKKGNPWTRAKAPSNFLPIASSIIPPSELDPQNCDIMLEVNGVVRQQGNTSDFIFTLADLISYLSHVYTLQEGDIILTGTPSGVAKLDVGDQATASLKLKNGKWWSASWSFGAKHHAPEGVKVYDLPVNSKL